MAEVWLRSLPVTTDPLRHLLLCTLQQTEEDVIATTTGLTDEQVWLRPHGLTPVGFHIRHIAESIDRLLTYAEGRSLDQEQLTTLTSELTEILPLLSLIVILDQRLKDARLRVNAIRQEDLTIIREIGRAKIPSPLGTILAHIAEHTQRHLGQLTTTVKLIQSTEARNPA
jgi:uncharacterized damage-inducible protein DinB